MIQLSFHRVRPEKVERLRAWMAELTRRRAEVLETFVGEGTRHEVVSLLMTEAGPLLVYVVERDPNGGGVEAFLASKLPIDIEHRAVIRECLIAPVEVERLLDIAAED